MLVRYFAQDDPKQAVAARCLIQDRLTREQPGHVNVVTLAETCWVLKRPYEAGRDELVQVVQNLVHNALKYGRPTGGHIALRTVRQAKGPIERRRVTLEIEDDGPGIATVHLPRLTERFYRVSPTVSRDRGGTGLGLAIVKNIIARHRGELGIRSEVGKGSTFTITLDELPR